MNDKLISIARDILNESRGKSNSTELSEAIENAEMLKALIDEYRYLVDPSFEPEDPKEYQRADKVIKIIRKKFGNKIAKQVEDGAYIMHFPRANHVYDWDELATRNKMRVTKSGKINKTDVKARKDYLKRYFRELR